MWLSQLEFCQSWEDRVRREEVKPRVIPYVSEVSEQLRRIFSKYRVSVAFKPQNTPHQHHSPTLCECCTRPVQWTCVVWR